MKKILLLSIMSILLEGFIIIPVIAQTEGSGSMSQEYNPYACEEDWIEVMFTGTSKVRIRNGQLTDLYSQALQGTDQILEKLAWHKWQRITDVPESLVDDWELTGERNTGKDIYNLNNIYRLQIPKGNDVWEICSELQKLPGIELAMPVPKPMAPPSPPPGSFQSQQGYLYPATNNPSGVEALWSWTQTGGTGAGVTVCDLEYSWNYSHADITKGIGSSLNSWTDPGYGTDHGTAVIGELVADNNGWGTTGICYGSNLKTCGTYYGSPLSWNVAGAIAIAISNLSAGDIILLEQQWDYSNLPAPHPGQEEFIPIEWWGSNRPAAQTNNAVYAAIVNAVANGIHVIEAGGNGNNTTGINTGLLTWYGNSGAIIVGAGGATTTNDRQRLGFSSYGPRFDLQGWGENVFTTGYGSYYSAEGVNYYYTSTFSGTSSASPIVTGALACAEGYYLANVSSTPPSPSYMRTHLATYGTAQVYGPSGNIGPRPNIKAAIQNFPAITYDYGDAPSPYPTLLAATGARHANTGLRMGNLIDSESDGQPTVQADGDDINPLVSDDEDGVIFTSALIPGQMTTIQITVSGAGILNAWIDFNKVNLWADAGEFIFQNYSLTAGMNNLSFMVPATALSGYTYARFRFSTTGGILFYGTAPNGEVEDYRIFIEESEGFDWGDAPDGPYPTLSASMGANHMIIPGMYLGNSVDGEQDGQPDPQALGDDLDIIYPPPNDDEDGITFKSLIVPGQSAVIDVVATQPGFLSAWIDFNLLNSWNDAGEQVLTDVSLNAGLNTITFQVPAGVPVGTTFARFRYSMMMGLGFAGNAPDGEVEDYQVTVTQGASGNQIDPDPGMQYVQNEISMTLLQGGPVITPVLLAAYNDHPYPGGPGLGVSYSSDGGTTWTALQLPYPPDPYGGGNFTDMFDPTATADANGNLYVAHISTDYDWTNGPASGLFVHKSTDGGITWNAPVAIATDGPPISNPDPNYRFNDRCQITADVNPGSPYLNNLYIVEIKDRGWNNSLLQSDIYFSASTDGGLTWSPQVVLNGSQSSMANMPVPAVAPDGTIYVSWLDYNVQTGGTGTIYLDVSTDGGVTWLPTDLTVMTIPLPPINLNGGTDVLAKGAPVIHTSPFNSQELYIVFAAPALTGDEANIIFIKSTDGGVTWTSGIMVNDDGTNNDQVLPWMDVKPNGTIDIAWYDRRNDPGDLNWEVYMATSTDGGNSFNANQMVSSFSAPSPNTPSGLWMGEYLGLVVDQTHAYLTFALASPDIQGDIYFNKIENPAIENLDFGDANDPSYPTLLANDGARHILDGVTYLGASVDPETDGQPDPNALGDDNNGNDDEDGVTFGQILVGGPAQITVTTSVAGYLQGWIDFNTDGDWADTGEQIFTDEYIHFGYTVCLNYMVPVSALIGPTYARFRFSNITGLSFVGSAPNGEVEDYQVEISQNPDIKWIQEPCIELPGLHAHDYSLPPYDYIILADDWMCNGGVVTDIHWWGNYELDASNQEKRGSYINHFHISIHADDPTGLCVPVNPELTGFDIPFSSLAEQNTGLLNNEGSIIYLYEFVLPQSFDQVPGTRYWIDICAYSNDPNNPAYWRWQESDRSTASILCPTATMTSTTPWQGIVWTSIQPYRYSDMAFIITSGEPEPMDYGDAPNPWPTLLINDGARHKIEPGFFLGANVDTEINGQPQGFALGDDQSVMDDEDGVAFKTALIPGQPASVDITMADPTGLGGFLDCWIDFNINGVFEQPAEHLCGGVSCGLVAGTNTINFNVPAGALVGPVTFARFRLSRAGGLLPTGLAPDGEVEDYRVFIVNPGETKMHWAQLPDQNPTGVDVDMFWVPLADDFLCTETGPISEIDMWGSFADDGLPAAGVGSLTFKLTIYSDNPAGTLLPWSFPKDTLWTDTIYPGEYTVQLDFQGPEWWYDPATYWWQAANHNMAFRYNFVFDDPFIQQLDSIYWLEIVDLPRPPQGNKDYTFGWKTSRIDLRWNDDACVFIPAPSPGTPWIVGWNDLRYPPTHDWQNSTLDLAFLIKSETNIDFGDATDPPYPTLLANNGAGHFIDGTTYLGISVDPDPDGQPDPNALGDDNNGSDDEDGVVFNSPLLAGSPALISVTAASNGLLNLWIDYDGDGTWLQPNEHVFIDFGLSAGTYDLNFIVPVNATAGISFARFRFSNQPALSYNGLAYDGEVEDYEVLIDVNPNFKWQQLPNSNFSGLHAHDATIPPYESIVLADDWLCSGGHVTDIHWWGNYEAVGSGIDHFHLSIHNDDPSGTCLPLDPEVWGVDVPFNSIIEQFTGMYSSDGKPIYLYEYVLPVPFDQIAGNRYWLDISAFSVDPNNNNQAIWRWQEAQRTYYPILCGAANKIDPGIFPWTTIQWNYTPPYMYSDMAFAITSSEIPTMDFGDLPDGPYPTLATNNGPSHQLSSLYFGSLIDAEWDGQPDPNAKGDDNANSDDEDGILFIGGIFPGETSYISVDVSQGNGYLQGWIDYNADGDFSDAGEQIFTDFALPVGNNLMTFTADPNATTGTTFARFRISTLSGLSYTGPAPDGEVEDYEVIIRHPVAIWHLDENTGTIAYDATSYSNDGTIYGPTWTAGYYNSALNFSGIWDYVEVPTSPSLDITSPFSVQAWIKCNGTQYYYAIVDKYEYTVTGSKGFSMYLTGGQLRLSVYSGVAGNGDVFGTTELRDNIFHHVLGSWDGSYIRVYIDGVLEGELPWTNAPVSTMQNVGIGMRLSGWGSYMPFSGIIDEVMISALAPPEMDFGDASDPSYPTLYVNDGARHFLDGFTFLGSGVDSDVNGQPDLNALGDDNDGADDEDGVSVIFPMIPGGTGAFDVTASVPGLLSTWIDFDDNGSWGDPGEQIFTDVTLWPGSNWLFVAVPANAQVGKTIARFRFSTIPGLSYTGLALDGEVEDHEVIIEGEVEVDLRVFLEGPYSGTVMTTTLNSLGYLPLSQPYNSDPSAIWYYSGSENVSSIPNGDITDWVLVEFRDAPTAASATRATMISMQAALVNKNGTVVGLDGSSTLKINGVFQYNPYVVIWHRNHLGVMSAAPLVIAGINYYSYDFTTGSGQAYLNGQKNLGGGIYGLYGGDGKPDELISNPDRTTVWGPQAGTIGYKTGDFNMNGQVNNPDKNTIWVPNLGQGTKVP